MATPRSRYVGRFAPTPSGPLHLGSAVAAIASWLDARVHNGRWLLRIDDIDTPRAVAGADRLIIGDLERLELEPDGPVYRQSDAPERYASALTALRELGWVFDCGCTRRQTGSGCYPGTCRHGLPPGALPRSVRMVVDPPAEVRFKDRFCGAQTLDLAVRTGAFVVRRADGLYAYHLATVVDDGLQGVTDVVRGADLLTVSGQQIWLQRALGLPILRYAHVPVVTNASGQKLSKQTHAAPLSELPATEVWRFCLQFF
ncbi:MAG: tRNA glutamyl-Q(34) synthetase GluQRS, partial [Pseudomonadota bacterium]